ncbi:GrpB family protein [Achromobacter xylosoxidans]|uniref:GrpB family protein n=1 Tax=Alcaligenes xylosoxydans xylosoxydans TaxID=85698 RepID=UPI000B48AEB6|nr:GrpB family protein [Achromobacter xylosoxidans]
MRHYEADPDVDPWVRGKPAPEMVAVVPYDPDWPVRYGRLEAQVLEALGPAALAVEHMGSTAVPGLPAKPVIDIDLTVADPVREDAYVPALEAAGYVLVLREPSWHQHRLLQLAAPRVNLHVFGPDCPENVRHRMFRDWLRQHDADRDLYARAKRQAAVGAMQVMEYNKRKEAVLRQIYERMFRAAGFI